MSERNRKNSGTHTPEQSLKRIFDAIPDRYDLLNRLLTLGLDGRWRRRAARWCLNGNHSRVLDLCCGTGKLALQIARLSNGAVEIVGLDFSAPMLEVARRKAVRSASGATVRFIEGDATAMKFPDGYFDSVGIAFALRNLTWRNPLGDQALAEVRRVLRPGGTFVVVETSQPANRVLRVGFHTYMKTIAAPVGGWISGHREAYRYLAQSARDFYDARGVCSMLASAGFEHICLETMMGGVAAIYVFLKKDSVIDIQKRTGTKITGVGSGLVSWL